jgi:uncharacterized integral membrane protein
LLSFFDEEPLFEVTDWNDCSILLLVGGFLTFFFELTLRARMGQYTSRDEQTLLASLTYFIWLGHYLRLLLLVFILHALTPLELDLVETSSLWPLAIGWPSSLLSLAFSLLICALLGSYLLKFCRS